LILFLQESNVVYTAHLNQSHSPWRTGSQLELTGICLLGSAGTGRVETVRILLQSGQDVRVLKAAPWWDLRRTLALLGILMAVALAAVLWTVTLRTQTRRQAAIIRNTLERENALRQRYRILFDQAGDMVFTLDAGGRILSFNKSGEQIMGYTQSEALQSGFSQWVSPGDAPKFEAWIKRIPQGVEPEPMEIEVIARDGRPLILDCSPRLRRMDGKAAGIQVIARDITENRRAQAEMDRATRKLEAVHMELTVIGQQLAQNRQALETEIREHMRAGMELERIHKEWLVVSRQAGMAELAAGVLHDIGSVLDGIGNSSTLLTNLLRQSDPSGLPMLAAQFRDVAVRMEKGGACTGELPPLLKQLEELAARLVTEQDKLVQECATLRANVEHANGVIATQQSHARKSHLLESIPIAILIEDAAALCKPAYVRSRVNLVRDFGALPEMETDRAKVLQILVRLLRNAVVACDESGQSDHQVTVTAMSEKDSWIVITISDTGIGIPQENLDRIFAQKGANPASRFHGLHGSALAAQSLGGTLTASSAGSGRGASFELRLPLRPENKVLIREGGPDV
jgi:PAS domain S-box-containing protein